jgi:hypothetical protein
MNLNFNTNEAKSTSWMMPKGEYDVRITKATMREDRLNLGGAGDYLNVIFEIENSEHSGTQVVDNFNLQHKTNHKAQYYRVRLASLCEAINVTDLSDTDDLIGMGMKVVIGMSSNGTKNVIEEYIPDSKLEHFELDGDKDDVFAVN